MRGRRWVMPGMGPPHNMRILLVCTGNSARSQMAEGLLQSMTEGTAEVYSAGTHPSRVNPLAVEVMKEVGIDISRHRSKSLDEFAGQQFDYIITVCDSAKEVCPVFPGGAKRLHWSFDDPAAAAGSEEERRRVFRRVRDEIGVRLRKFVKGSFGTQEKGREEEVERIRVLAGNQAVPRKERAGQIAEAIRAARAYRWVGVYDVSTSEIAAVAWTGTEAPAFPRFAITQGLCGAAVSARAPVVVGDVTKDPRYLTTFGSTRSEMVMPVLGAAGAVVGLIDVESERLHAFTDIDCAFLESCASALLPLWV